MQANLQNFRALVDDPALTDSEITKYLTWGKGNLEQALNYYYRRLEKNASSMAGQGVKQEKKESKQSEQMATRSRSSNAFERMKNGSKKEKKIEDFIAHVKEQYQLPLTRPNKKGSKKMTQNGVNEKVNEGLNEGEDSELEGEFADADYIPAIFDRAGDSEEGQWRNRSDVGREQVDLEVLEGDSMENSFMEEIISRKQQQKVQQNPQAKSSPARPIPIEKEESKSIANSKSKANSKPEEIQKMAPVFNPPQRQPPKPLKESSSSSQFGWTSGQSEFLLGETILFAFALKFQNSIDLPEGTPIHFRYYIQQQKKKKGFKSKKAQKIMNLRLIHRNSEFGRLKNEESMIFVPLLVSGMVRIELASHTVPKRIDYYTQLKVTARVYLLRKAVTDPVVETFEGHSDLVVSTYKPVAEELLALFQRLQLRIVTWPLIKRQSRIKSQSRQFSSKQSFASLKDSNNDSFSNSVCNGISNGINNSKGKTEETERERELEREKKMRNDPFFKTVQKNLTQMFTIASKEDSNSVRPKQEEQKGEDSAVKKKVVEIRTVDEDRCQQLVDLYEQDIQPAKPGPLFSSELYNYQALALAWMLGRQREDKDESGEGSLHPLWTEFQAADKRSVYLNELTSQVSLKPPYSRAKCLGGILADEMGLGKTVMMAALIATNSQPRKSKREGGTLIIVPLTLLSQWQSQLQTHTKSPRILVYYSSDRLKSSTTLEQYQTVITTYGTVSYEYSKGFHIAKTGIYRYSWERIVLDEAHYIKGRVIQTAKAVYELEGQYRWCLTGTPIQNGLADLFSLLHFVRYTPWAEWECFNKYILKPAEAGQEEVYSVLKTILKRVFLRRTKQSKDAEGRPIVELPPKSSKVEILQMTQKQRLFYDSIYESSRLKMEELERLGILEAKYMQVFQILMRLRQICCHPMLFRSVHKFSSSFSEFEQELRAFIKKRAANQSTTDKEDERYFQPLIEGEEQQRIEVSTGPNISQKYLKQTLAKIQKNQLQTCLVCLGDIEDPVITSCLHIFCRVCSIRQIQQLGNCSACRNRIAKEDILPLPRENRFNTSMDSFFPSTKLIALTEHLRRLKPGDKAVVFSQFLGMLDLIEHQLRQEKVSFVRMEGSTAHRERTRIVSQFQKDPSVQVFVVSLKTAGVGLNLVAANKVFLVDPWWNPGVEEQAIERVHRIGQKRAVEVVRLVMDRSIEMRMLEMNTSKKVLSQKVLSHDGKDRQGVDSKMEKLKYLMAKY